MFVVYFCILLPLSVSIHFNCMDKYSCFYHRRLPLFMMSIIYLYSSENIPEANCSSARTNLNLARFVLYSLLFFFCLEISKTYSSCHLNEKLSTVYYILHRRLNDMFLRAMKI